MSSSRESVSAMPILQCRRERRRVLCGRSGARTTTRGRTRSTLRPWSMCAAAAAAKRATGLGWAGEGRVDTDGGVERQGRRYVLKRPLTVAVTRHSPPSVVTKRGSRSTSHGRLCPHSPSANRRRQYDTTARILLAFFAVCVHNDRHPPTVLRT